jgi:hypothetical protein
MRSLANGKDKSLYRIYSKKVLHSDDSSVAKCNCKPNITINTHFKYLKFIMGPIFLKRNKRKTHYTDNPQKIGFRAIVMLIFILYANKIGIENHQQYYRPHRF